MRVRSVLAALGAATLLASLTAAPATAGTGSSSWCTDRASAGEVPVGVEEPVTAAVQLYTPSPGVVWVCFSPTPVGQPGAVAGGSAGIVIKPSTDPSAPGLVADVTCVPDAGFWCSGTVANSIHLSPASVTVGTPPSSICLLSLSSGCVAFVPGVKITDRDPGNALVTVQLLGTTVPVNPLPACVAVVVTCP